MTDIQIDETCVMNILNTKNDVETFMLAGEQTDKGFGHQSDLYMNLITEECIHELLKEFDKNNLVGIADGIIDTIWVINGFINTFDELEKNLIWNCQIDKKESSDYMMISIVKFYAELRWEYALQKNINIKLNNAVSTHVNGICSARISFDLKQLIQSLVNLGVELDLPLQKLWDEVARSNLSKIPESGKIIKNEAGKIQKPDTYSPPDIKTILLKHNLI